MATIQKRRGGPSSRPLKAGPAPAAAKLNEARRAFLQLDRGEQFRLAQEMVQAREAELLLAYKNVTGLGFGYKTRGAGKGRAPKLHRIVCVTFVVSRKWKTPGRPGDPQRLPRFLYTYATVSGERELCAVPTDVRPASDYGVPRPHAGEDVPFGVTVSAGGGADVTGNVSCRISRPNFPGQVFALSCRHVFSRSLMDASEPGAGCPVKAGGDDSPAIGKTTGTRGPLVAAPDPSFDAQLARVDNPRALRVVTEGLRFDPGKPYALSQADLEDGFWIATPRAGEGGRLRIWADFHSVLLNMSMVYPLMQGAETIIHPLVIHAVAREELMPGDSGSPAIRTEDGNRLMGMYLGGDRVNAYFIPAWELFDPRNYGVSGEAGWSMVAP